MFAFLLALIVFDFLYSLWLKAKLKEFKDLLDLLDFRLSALEDLHITDAELSQFISYESRITALEADTVETTAILGNIITRIDGLAEWHSRCEPVEESTVKTTQE